jgi:uncharacterized membrane protein
MEQHLSDWAQLIALVIDYGAVIFVGLAALVALVQAFGLFLARVGHEAYSPVRWLLARRLTMALELMIASDIIRTAVNPTWVDLGQLAATIVLRELINVTLRRDIQESSRDRRGTSPT